MITTADLAGSFDDLVLRKAACPICLSKLLSAPGGARLTCSICNSMYYTMSGLPVFLVQDENQRMKEDEVKGELEYNAKKIPPEVHEQRNAFVNRNSQLFFDEYRMSLAGKQVLAVGCSMAEAEFCSTMTDRLVCLDIGPTLAGQCRQACIDRKIPAAWICGDGECLPLENEAFDVVIVRQALHHMLKYYSAISEFFRVCKVGGTVVILDEPFAGLNPQSVDMDYPDNMTVYENVSFGRIRELAGIQLKSRSVDAPRMDIGRLEQARTYIAADSTDAQTLLADKYHDFSLLNCIYAMRLYTDDIYLSWPEETAWTDESGETVRFCHGLNPNYAHSVEQKLISPGNVSIAAQKRKASTLVRSRHGLRAISLPELISLDPGFASISAER